MRVCVIRVRGMAEERIAVLRRLEKERSLIHETTEYLVDEEDLSDPGFLEQLSGLIKDAHVLFVAVPGAYATHLAVQALRMGVHTFLGRSAAPSIAECKMIAALGEEAGVEAGISRIMRFHPFLDALPTAWRANALTVRHDIQSWHQTTFQQMIEDAVDLCCSLAGMGDVRKIEAQQVQNSKKQPGSLMVGFRFQNGTYAQIQLRHGAVSSRHDVYAGGATLEFEVDLQENKLYTRNKGEEENDTHRFAFEGQALPNCNLIEQETIAFLNAIADQKPVPVSIMDGLQTLQLVEGIRKSLR